MRRRPTFKYIFFVATIFVLFHLLKGAAVAQQPAEFGIMGAGSVSCARFGESYKQKPSETELTFFTWAQGFMSGINVGLYSTKQKVTNLNWWNTEQQMEKIRSYCADNPLKDYESGVWTLFDAIRAAQGLPKVH